MVDAGKRRTGTCLPGDHLPHVRCAAGFAEGGPANNGANRIRTGDPLLAKQVLYQLSYGPSDPVEHAAFRASHRRQEGSDPETSLRGIIP